MPALLPALLVVALLTGSLLPEAEIPETTAGTRAAAFFTAFNSGDDEAVAAFERAHRAASALAARPVEERVRQLAGLRQRLGRLEPVRIVNSQPHTLRLVAEGRGGETVEMTFELEPEPPHKLEAVMLALGAEPSEQDTRPLDPTARAASVEEFARAMESTYVYPERGREMAAALREKAARGGYDGLETSGALARQVETDLRAICEDRHLAIRPVGPERETRVRIPGESRQGNHGFERVEVLPGNIGCIRLNGFVPGDAARETAAAALALVRNCDALVFDVRGNGGGSPEMIQFLSSYLFAEPTHLNSFYDRRSERTSETWTLADVPGKRFDADVPVYVLTSHYTFSAAEEFTYNLKNLKRATIVGETTGGGAHPVTMRTIEGRFEVAIPFARAFNPITKKNWEGVGVEPDVPCAADDALERACDLARAKTAG